MVYENGIKKLIFRYIKNISIKFFLYRSRCFFISVDENF